MKTELLEKTSTPVYKRCSRCGEIKPVTEFYTNGYGKFRADCKVCQLIYWKSENGKASLKRYAQSDRGRESNRRSCAKYSQTEKGKISKRKRDALYYNSEKGRAAHLRQKNSDAFKEWQREYINSGRSAEVHRVRYYKIQDEAGCHMDIRDFYPAYRFIKALENAPIVEIKV